MNTEFRVIIPARYASTRLPGKVLLDIRGKSMLQHVYERALESGAESVTVATDDERIQHAAEKFGAKVYITSSTHTTGTDRLAEAVESLELEDDEIVVNVQADEPMIPPAVINQVANDLAEHDNIKVATLCEPIVDVEYLFDTNIVKVVFNRRGYAMYFSRAPIPWDRDNFSDREKIDVEKLMHFRHIGIYAYRAGFLKSYLEWVNCPLENLEKLEQLRVLWNGGRIHVAISQHKVPVGVNTPEDLQRVLGMK